jgi:AraC family transcriptional regulator of adaptative response/methylated-DNA-[protein]-cysteine methyltransferase
MAGGNADAYGRRMSKTPSRHRFTGDDARWRAVLASDARADGEFLYSVRTTGIYCRPSCGARRPRREHVAFHPSPAAAEAAGFRACKRCRPNETTAVRTGGELVTRACRLIAQSEAPVTLADLAKAVGVSPFHLHRRFKAVVGVTPRQYAARLRDRRFRDELSDGVGVASAVYGAGFGSSRGAYESARARMTLTPSVYRAGAPGIHIRYASAPTSLGIALVAATARGICSIALGDDEAVLLGDLRRRFSRATLTNADGAMTAAIAAAIALVEGQGTACDLPLDVAGTAFEERVWAALRAIPEGETRSYGEVAASLGAPRASRAVARACAANRLAIAIPCHRVVRGDGALGGYRWGLGRKKTLLARERSAAGSRSPISRFPAAGPLRAARTPRPPSRSR